MRTVLPLAFLSLLAAAPLHAQQSRFTGSVADSVTGAPLAGVRVSLIELQRSALTGDDGRFEFVDLPAGVHTLAVRHLGYEPVAMRFRLRDRGEPVVDLGAFRLTRLAVQLDPLVIQAQLIAENPQMESFFRRMQTEQGTFFTLTDILREDPQVTSDLIRRVPGWTTTEGGEVENIRGIPSMFRGCTVQYFIDGAPAAALSIDIVQPQAIAGIELYAGASTTPPMYRGHSVAQCGVIAIWTRRGQAGRQ